MKYLERYRYGEYEKVWDELFDHDGEIRQKDLYDDAFAVALETMRRVRKNIEVLIERLVHIGFVFGYDHCVQRSLERLDTAEARRSYLESLSWMHHQPPVFLSANQIEEEKAEEEEMIHTVFSPITNDELEELRHTFRRITKDHDDQFPSMGSCINEIEQLIGPVPLSIHAWYNIVGGVNFSGFHPEWQKHANSLFSENSANIARPTLIYACDPLQVYPLNTAFMNRARRKHVQGKEYRFEFASDRSFKDNYGGAGTPYAFFIPDTRADVWLVDLSKTFVQYLRVSILQWAGFPGMAEWRTIPKEDLAFLTHDLLPF